jgi:nicotinamide-nucleotide amidase
VAASPAPSDARLAALAGEVALCCLCGGFSIATAESCTGGYIAKVLTDLPGSSQWFGAGFVTYSNAAKTTLLGVPAGILETHGAVSEAVVCAMAEGAWTRAAARRAVAVSGIAGPTGGSAAKPVGTVWLAWAGPDRPTRSEVHHFAGDRDAIRRQAVLAALEGLLGR